MSTLQGWLPILDSFQGIRGEIYVVIKVEWMDDLNPFKDSSASVHFASSLFKFLFFNFFEKFQVNVFYHLHFTSLL